MAKIEGLRIRNYRSLKDVSLGKLWGDWRQTTIEPLTDMTAVIGKNGAGKSTLFDAFGFLSDCLKLGVEDACDARGRGGFGRILSKEQVGPICFEIYYREDGESRPITYELDIDLDKHGRPYVAKERLRQRRKGQKTGQPYSFLVLNEGRGIAWKGEEDGRQIDESKLNLLALTEEVEKQESTATEQVQLSDNRRLGIATLGSLKQHERIIKFRNFIEGWYLSYFTPDAARSMPLAGPQKHLNIHGDNIGNVVQFLERENPDQFKKILDRIALKIPGIKNIQTTKTDDGRLLLKFNDQGFKDPFYAQQMSDGTLKVFAYLLLMEDPSPPPFICVEEPENGLYHKLLERLAHEFREHAEKKAGPQVFITTHQPYFVDALEANEVWILQKGDDGFSKIQRASQIEFVKNMMSQGQTLGALWYSDYLDAG